MHLVLGCVSYGMMNVFICARLSVCVRCVWMMIMMVINSFIRVHTNNTNKTTRKIYILKYYFVHKYGLWACIMNAVRYGFSKTIPIFIKAVRFCKEKIYDILVVFTEAYDVRAHILIAFLSVRYDCITGLWT